MDEDIKARPGVFRRFMKIALWMIMMAIVGAWVMALAYPLAIKAGLSEATASRLPNYGLYAGSAFGLILSTMKKVKFVFGQLGLILVTALVFWFFGLYAESILVAFGVREKIADWAPFAGFWLGLLLSGFAMSVVLYEKIEDTLGRRKTPKSH